VAGYAIRVIGYVLSFSGATNARWMSGAGGGAVALSGLIYGGASMVEAPGDVGKNGRGWFQTAPGAPLNLNLSAGVAVGGHVLYELAPQT